jgi:hypothetical protein
MDSPERTAENKSLGCRARIDSADSVCKISVSDAGDTAHRGLPSQTVGIIRGLSNRLHVGANDIADPADFGVAVDFVDASFLLAKAILQCLNCNIESDLVPKLKSVGDSFRSRINADTVFDKNLHRKSPAVYSASKPSSHRGA